MNWRERKTRELIRELASNPAGVTSADVTAVNAETARKYLGRMRDEGLLVEIPYGKGEPARFFVSDAQRRKFLRDTAEAEAARIIRHKPKHAKAWWDKSAEPVITSETIVTIAPAPVRSLRSAWGVKELWR